MSRFDCILFIYLFVTRKKNTSEKKGYSLYLPVSDSRSQGRHPSFRYLPFYESYFQIYQVSADSRSVQQLKPTETNLSRNQTFVYLIIIIIIIIIIITIITQVLVKEQKLVTLPEFMPVFSGIRFVQSLVFCVMLCGSLCVLCSVGRCIVSVQLTAFVWSLCCLCITHSFRLLIVLLLCY